MRKKYDKVKPKWRKRRKMSKLPKKTASEKMHSYWQAKTSLRKFAKIIVS
jgi:hypothetical protein